MAPATAAAGAAPPSVPAIGTPAATTSEKKIPQPSPVRSVLAGSLAGGIEIGGFELLLFCCCPSSLVKEGGRWGKEKEKRVATVELGLTMTLLLPSYHISCRMYVLPL